MATLQWPFEFQRLNRAPLDAASVFANMAALNTYLASGARYAGQIVAVRNATNTPDIYQVNENFTVSQISGAAEGVTTGGTGPPPSPGAGDIWTTINGELFVWDGTFWVQIGW